MKHIKCLTILFFLCLSFNVYAQLSTNEKPVSFIMKSEMKESKRTAFQTVTTPVLDMEKIEAEDEEDDKYDMPPRFGYSHRVNYDLNNSGTWYTLPNGDKLWQLNVICPNALSVNFCYDKFWLPDGGKLFVFSKDKKHSIGAFTSRNNKGTREQLRGFATGLIYGCDVTLEYYQPKEVNTDAIISIEFVVHGYRYIDLEERSFGNAGNCMVNVNCEEGLEWQNEKKAIALIIVNGERYCTGSLINTTDLSQKPYLLTADHCLGGWANNNIKYDAVTLPNLDHYSFYWDYEAPGCSNVNVEPNYYTTSGATILANNIASDFALLRLTEDPMELSSYTPFYLGWDNTGLSGNPGVCIHHPRGDVKKISTVNEQPTSSYWLVLPQYTNSHWLVTWKETLNGHGIVKSASSGAPLYNAAHKVIGQLHGGTCKSCVNISGYSKFGKYDVSWTGNGNDSIQRRLNCWIDSLNSGIQIMEGLLVISTVKTFTTNEQIYSNICITRNGQLTIQSDVELMGNSRVIVEGEGKLIINGGTLSNVDLFLKPGATLRIINNGTIETHNTFEAQVGSIVDIVYGKII